MKRVEVNDEIKRIGVKYNGHCNVAEIRVEGSNWYIKVPKSRVGEFCRLFPDVNWENGEYLHVLHGRYVRVEFDDDGRVHVVRHIVKNLEYFPYHPEVN